VTDETSVVVDKRVSFDAESSKRDRLDASAFGGRVPVVLAFVGEGGERADSLILAFDASLAQFGERRIQLLVVVEGYPSETAERLGVNVALITDDELGSELGAKRDAQGHTASVIVGNDGHVIEVVRHQRHEEEVSDILTAVERLAAEFPERFSVLPDPHGDSDVDHGADGGRGQANTSPESDRPTFRQRLAWLTGDRNDEAKALANIVAGQNPPDETVLAAAKLAVSDAHGDSSVREIDPVTSDVATPVDVIERLDP
jgi:peroxiredoxin